MKGTFKATSGFLEQLFVTITTEVPPDRRLPLSKVPTVLEQCGISEVVRANVLAAVLQATDTKQKTEPSL